MACTIIDGFGPSSRRRLEDESSTGGVDSDKEVVMKNGRVFCSLILLFCGFAAAASAEEAVEADSALVHEELALCTFDPAHASLEELTEWAPSVGGTIQSQIMAGGDPPPCPTVVPFCPSLTPVGCPPDSCRKTASCSSEDLGTSSCQISPNILFFCTSGKTVHKTTCHCAATCPGTMCGYHSELDCQ